MNRKLIVRGAISAGLLIAASTGMRAADDGATLYKSKCSGCHGAAGEGKPAMKAPALKGIDWDADRIAKHITTGEPDAKPPHKKGVAGVSDDQAKAIASFVKTLK